MLKLNTSIQRSIDSSTSLNDEECSPMTSVFLSLDLIRLTTDSDDPLAVQCASCHGALVLHQPDEELPSRLLGTCQECRTWFLIDGDAELMVKLPDENMLRNA
jgi:hypothetical protein